MTQPPRSHGRLDSLRHAFAGWWYALRTQHNAWIHAVASLVVLALAGWLVRDLVHWVLLIQAIAAVWIAEFFNTAMEAVVDLASPEFHPLAKTGKDVAAAAVLVAAGSALVVGVLILGPPLWAKLGP